jgi:hypothetical protein
VEAHAPRRPGRRSGAPAGLDRPLRDRRGGLQPRPPRLRGLRPGGAARHHLRHRHLGRRPRTRPRGGLPLPLGARGRARPAAALLPAGRRAARRGRAAAVAGHLRGAQPGPRRVPATRGGAVPPDPLPQRPDLLRHRDRGARRLVARARAHASRDAGARGRGRALPEHEPARHDGRAWAGAGSASGASRARPAERSRGVGRPARPTWRPPDPGCTAGRPRADRAGRCGSPARSRPRRPRAG